MDDFPRDVVELMAYFRPEAAEALVQAVPATGQEVPVWILGSSTFGAQLAAYLGLPYAFASHFAPQMLSEAAQVYRESFRPSSFLERPYFMLGAGLFAAETDAEAAHLRTSMQLSFARLRSGAPGKLPPPVDDIEAEIGQAMLASVNIALSCSATGSPQTVRAELSRIIDRYEPDEIILTGHIYDHAARLRSFQIGAEAMREVGAVAA